MLDMRYMHPDDDPYVLLGNAIVEQAARDLKDVLRRKQKADKNLEYYETLLADGKPVRCAGKMLTMQTLRREVTKAKEHQKDVGKELRDLEQFFWSDWCALLSDIDGPALLEAIEAEYGGAS